MIKKPERPRSPRTVMKMQIINVPIGELKPYENNPRVNDKAIEYVAESIREFGFKVPMVITPDKVIIACHTRLAAALSLGIKEVPCVLADDLTEEQARAFRLADNKVSEQAGWDLRKLDIELSGIKTIEMKKFDFKIPKIRRELGKMEQAEADAAAGIEPQDNGYFGDERERTYNSVNLHDYDPYRTDGFYQMPIVGGCDYVPEDMIGFKYVKARNIIPEETAVHFFIDDYQFERIWNQPAVYVGMLLDRGCESALTPDFSLYIDMPRAMMIWNVYRSRLIGQIMGDAGIKVIPTLQFADPESYKFCFDGILPGGVVATSNVGVVKDPEATKVFIEGMDEAIKRIQPEKILCYGIPMDDYDFQGVEVRFYEPTSKPGRWD